MNSCQTVHPRFFLVSAKMLKARIPPAVSRCFKRDCGSVCRLVERLFIRSICRTFDEACWNLCAPQLDWASCVATILKKVGCGRRVACLRLRDMLGPRMLESFSPTVNGSVLTELVCDLLRVWHSPVDPLLDLDGGHAFAEACPFEFSTSDLSVLRERFRRHHAVSPSMDVFPYACLRKHCINALVWAKQLRVTLAPRVCRLVWKLIRSVMRESLSSVPSGVFRNEFPATEGDMMFSTSVWSTQTITSHNKHTSIANCTDKLLRGVSLACVRLVDDIECIFWPVLVVSTHVDDVCDCMDCGGVCVHGRGKGWQGKGRKGKRGRGRGRGHRAPAAPATSLRHPVVEPPPASGAWYAEPASALHTCQNRPCHNTHGATGWPPLPTSQPDSR